MEMNDRIARGRSVARSLMSGALLLSLWTVASGQALPAGGTLNLPTPGQTGQITFTGTPGQYVAVTLQEGREGNNSYIPSIQVTVTAPDGTTLNGTVVMDYQQPTYSFTCPTGGCFGNSIINLGPLPSYAAGTTYTVTVQTTGNGGYLDYNVTAPLVETSPLVVNAAAVDEYVGIPGQGMLIPVTLTGNQDYILTVSEQSRNMPVIEVDVLDASGRVVQGAGMSATCASPCTIGRLNAYSGSEGDGIAVSTTGQYTLRVYQETQVSGANAYPPLDNDFYLQIQTH